MSQGCGFFRGSGRYRHALVSIIHALRQGFDYSALKRPVILYSKLQCGGSDKRPNIMSFFSHLAEWTFHGVGIATVGLLPFFITSRE